MERTSEQAAGEIEAGGPVIRVERAPRRKVEVGDRCSVHSKDGTVFIGTAIDFSSCAPRADVRLT